ncbi:DUF4062 domain-containing protein [Terrilactibacillus tamarindi]|nr:DUF4062 domain-containing protein [Terrilactibacillus tamarindi]
MPNPAKIFISSAYDKDLIPMRRGLKKELEDAGHSVLMFEDNFYPWNPNFMKTCLQKVIESNIFILLLNANEGTYWEEHKCTPTYQEFRTAVKEGKYIIAFLDTEIKNMYEEHIKADLIKRYDGYVDQNHRKPDYTMDLVNCVIENDLGNRQREKVLHIHPFVWAFIFDVQAENIWTEELVLVESEAAYRKIKGYLSDSLGEGIKLVPMKENIYENAIAAEEFATYQDYTITLLSYMDNGTITNWTEFLEAGIKPLMGDKIYQRPGTVLAEEIGHFEHCTALTVYKLIDDTMKLCGSYGAKTPTTGYALTNEDSYVIETFLQKSDVIGYSKEKNLLYYTLNIKDYVLCFHYPLDDTWNEVKVEAFKNEISCAIIKTTLFTDFLADLIGGIRYV